MLNLGASKVLSVHAATARQIVRSPHFRGDVQVVNFTPITSMYGAVHCSSQVRQEPLSQRSKIPIRPLRPYPRLAALCCH